MKYFDNGKAKVIVDTKKQKLVVYADNKKYKGKLTELSSISESNEDSKLVSEASENSLLRASLSVAKDRIDFLEKHLKLSAAEWQEYNNLEA